MSSRTRNLALFPVVFVLIVGAVCLVNGMRRVGRPFPGFLVAENGIVMSVARATWGLEDKDRIFFGKIVAVDGTPVSNGMEIQRYVEGRTVGTPITYRLRKGANIFTESVRVGRFDVSDFLSIYASYFLVGFCFAMAGISVLLRQPHVGPPATAFFAICLTIASILCTGGDVYGPYWFTPIYFLAHAASPAALLHLSASFPQPIGAGSLWRRIGVTAMYAGSAVVGILVILGFGEPSTFLPLLYTVYLLLANAIVLYVTRLAVEYGGSGSADVRRRVGRALGAVVLSGTAATVIFIVYPALRQPISPVALVVPLVLFPVLTVPALRGMPAYERRIVSVRSRLSLLLLASVEMTFLISVGLFWVNDSWQRLLDDFAVNERQIRRVVLSLDAEPAELGQRIAEVEANVQTAADHTLVLAAGAALGRGDRDGARAGLERLRDLYDRDEGHLHDRRHRLVGVSSTLVVALVIAGLLNAVGFMFLIRRWLIRPIERLASATAVIATGNLSYRIQPASTDEFAMLARSIDTMAASLGAIQRRIALEREARRNAAGAVRDTERRRLARELHDGALQNLTAVKYGLEGELKRRGSIDLAYVLDGATKCIMELRAIVDDLRAPDLTEMSLPEAIAEHAHALTHGRDIDLELDLPHGADVSPWARQDVYRVAQEAIANAVRHADPKNLIVRLYPRGSSMVLEVEDDGCGFDIAGVPPGNGIVGMRERSAVLGADLLIESTPQRGTTIRLDVPLGDAAQSD